MTSTPRPSRGEVWNVRFDPAVDAEIRKDRPAVVLDVDAVGRLPLRLVVPVTDWKPAYARYGWMVHLPAVPSNGLSKESAADAFQVKSISETRFLSRLGAPTDQQVDRIAGAVALCVGSP